MVIFPEKQKINIDYRNAMVSVITIHNHILFLIMTFVPCWIYSHLFVCLVFCFLIASVSPYVKSASCFIFMVADKLPVPQEVCGEWPHHTHAASVGRPHQEPDPWTSSQLTSSKGCNEWVIWRSPQKLQGKHEKIYGCVTFFLTDSLPLWRSNIPFWCNACHIKSAALDSKFMDLPFLLVYH